MYKFSATCMRNDQAPTSEHVATLRTEHGRELVIPSQDRMFEVGANYVISIEGELRNPYRAVEPHKAL